MVDLALIKAAKLGQAGFRPLNLNWGVGQPDNRCSGRPKFARLGAPGWPAPSPDAHCAPQSLRASGAQFHVAFNKI